MKSLYNFFRRTNNPHARDVFIALIFVLCAGAAVLVYSSSGISEREFNELARKSFSDQREFWKADIRERGMDASYTAFKKLNADSKPGPRHLLAHVFGAALYEEKNVDGIAACDSTFGFGCFHGFFMAAVLDGGVASIRPLDEACVKSFGPLGTGCQHGIGHGIVEYMGHNKLEESLALCSETTEMAPLIGCSSGVYMEYFLQTGLLGTATSSEPKQYDSSAPYGPCSSVPERYRSACFWALPNWWEGSMDGVSFEKIAQLCSEIAHSDDRNACMLGVGGIVSALNGFDAARSADMCDEISHGGDRVHCRAGVAWNVFSVVRPADSGRSACNGLSMDDRSLCLQAADYTNGLDRDAP